MLDFGAVARLPQGQLPEAMGRLIRIALESDEESLVAGLRVGVQHVGALGSREEEAEDSSP